MPLSAQPIIDRLQRLPPSEPLKIFLTHGSHTGGHRAAAVAVKAELDSLPNVHAEIIDALDYSRPVARHAHVGVANFAMNKVPRLRGWFFRKSFEGNPLIYWLGSAGMKFKCWTTRALLRKIQDEKPDAVLSCHSPMNAMLGTWKRLGKFDIPVQSVVTDFRAHRFWAQRGVDRYYVASDSVRGDLEKFGVPDEKIDVSGIPIERKFAAERPARTDARQALGLDPNLPMVLMTGGSLGYGPFAAVAQAIANLHMPVQMVCVTGKNEARKKELEALASHLSMPLRVVGFTPDLEQYMDAADVVVSKPGGSTTAEIFARSVPMVMVGAAAGLERMLIPSVVASGGAVAAADAEDAARVIGGLLTDPAQRSALESSLARASKPHAAQTVALELVAAALDHRDLVKS